ncbi:MAG: c-type cytochrome, partial [Bacteroidota bacterium]
VYRPRLEIADPDGTSSSQELVVIAGNDAPVVSISTDGNESYFFKDKSAGYQVLVNDAEDGTTADSRIASDAVSVTMNFLEDGYDQTMIAQGHQQPNHPGELLIAESDCKACHMIDQRSAGPAYREVAKKYKGDAGAIDRLANKIIKGGTGVWGDVAMAAHPQISIEDAAAMVSYILSLSEEKKQGLPISGSVKFSQTSSKPFNTRSAYVMKASYSDRGKDGLPPLSVSATKVWRAPFLTGEDDAVVEGGVRVEGLPTVGKAFSNVTHGSVVTFKNVDLRGVSSVKLTAVEMKPAHVSGEVDILIGGKDGTKVATVSLSAAAGIPVQSGILMKTAQANIPAQTAKSDLTLRFRNPAAGEKVLFILINAELGSR